jgi:hypothetical protein
VNEFADAAFSALLEVLWHETSSAKETARAAGRRRHFMFLTG